MQVLPPRVPQLVRWRSPTDSGYRANVGNSVGFPASALPLDLCYCSFLIAYATGYRVQYFAVHEAAGIALFVLLIFRVIWGFAGNQAAHFSSFFEGTTGSAISC